MREIADGRIVCDMSKRQQEGASSYKKIMNYRAYKQL